MIHLQFPPSLNHYYRHVGSKVLISAEGRQYRNLVAITVRDLIDRGLAVARPEGAIRVEVQLCPPDQRRRDLDNCLKAMLDACTNAGLWGDDSQIHVLVAHWIKAPVPHAYVIVTPVEPRK